MLNSEFSSLRDDIDRVAAATTFDGVSLLSGDGASPGSPNVIDFGSSDTAGESVTVSINAADSTSLSPDLATVDLASQAGGSAAVTAVTAAQASVDDIRAAVRCARAQLNSVGAAAGETSAIVERVQEMKTPPETVIELSRVVASQVTEERGLRIQDGAQKLLQNVLLRMSAATANGGPAAGSDAVEEFGGKTGGAPAGAAEAVETDDSRGDDSDG
jgi:flagellin